MTKIPHLQDWKPFVNIFTNDSSFGKKMFCCICAWEIFSCRHFSVTTTGWKGNQIYNLPQEPIKVSWLISSDHNTHQHVAVCMQQVWGSIITSSSSPSHWEWWCASARHQQGWTPQLQQSNNSAQFLNNIILYIQKCTATQIVHQFLFLISSCENCDCDSSINLSNKEELWRMLSFSQEFVTKTHV